MRSDCYEWTGPRGGSDDAYGSFYSAYRGCRVYAHRAMYEAAWGPIPNGMVVRHSCDNPICINPSHLSVGTHADNTRDMQDRERGVNRLKGADRDEVRRRVLAGEKMTVLAAEFGVSHKSVATACDGIRPGQGVKYSVLSKAEREEIVSRAARGEVMAQLAREFGVDPGTVRYHVARCKKNNNKEVGA